MQTLRRANDRGDANHGWLHSRHTFSFANYHDPAHMGFRNLRVINEDIVAAGQGFGTHNHHDMEILSYVLEGALQHRDSMGTGSIIRPGDLQRMTAGTGVAHSEFNASPTEPVHFLQIWLLPQERDLEPGYEQKSFTTAAKQGRLCLLAAPYGEAGSVTLNANASLYAGVFAAGDSADHGLKVGQHAWVHVARGQVQVNGQLLHAGDALALSDEAAVRLEGVPASGEILLFELI